VVLQAYLAGEIEKSRILSPVMRQAVRRKEAIRGAFDDLESASLLLIDRTQDLVSPIRHVNEVTAASSADSFKSVSLNSATSLGHRILSTLRASCTSSGVTVSGCEIPVLSSPESVLSHRHTVDRSQDMKTADADLYQASSQLHDLSTVMSGLAGLPYPCKPSICLYSSASSAGTGSSGYIPGSVKTSMGALQHALLCQPEDHTRVLLCDCLRTLILYNRGSLPAPKKRGLGAEILAYMQALLQAPGSDTVNISPMMAKLIHINRCNTPLCLKVDAVLAVCAAVVDCMQRSNGKQLAQLCTWMCSYDHRAVREAAVFGILLGKKPGEADETINVKMTNAMKQIQKYVQLHSGSGIAGSSDPGAMDCMHVLLMFAAVVCDLGWQSVDIEELYVLAGMLKDFFMVKWYACSSPTSIWKQSLPSIIVVLVL
jgi:hypothetical protein